MEISTLLRPRPRQAAFASASAAVLFALAGWSIWLALADRRNVESTTSQLRQLQAERKPIALPRPNRAHAETQRRWTALRAEQSFAWYPVFRALEDANNPDIELLEFVPDKAARRLLLRGEARNQEVLTAYMAALSLQPVFSELHLAHQKVVRKAGMDVLAFEIRSVIDG